ncbi:hypothetical protein RUM44_004451 [Polyplax serrata]|uniref:Uncharacterized protein n=1 Tax=Polyplax serrata TaxID=468196 RepID=A0ABR1B2W0_POLSC
MRCDEFKSAAYRGREASVSRRKKHGEVKEKMCKRSNPFILAVVNRSSTLVPGSFTGNRKISGEKLTESNLIEDKKSVNMFFPHALNLFVLENSVAENGKTS